MTVEDLKNELLGKTYPSEVRISKDQVVVDIDLFFNIQFDGCDNWTKDISKCPYYVRLVKFYEATRELE